MVLGVGTNDCVAVGTGVSCFVVVCEGVLRCADRVACHVAVFAPGIREFDDVAVRVPTTGRILVERVKVAVSRCTVTVLTLGTALELRDCVLVDPAVAVATAAGRLIDEVWLGVAVSDAVVVFEGN